MARVDAVTDLPVQDPANSMGRPPGSLTGLSDISARLVKLEIAVDGADGAPTPDDVSGFDQARGGAQAHPAAAPGSSARHGAGRVLRALRPGHGRLKSVDHGHDLLSSAPHQPSSSACFTAPQPCRLAPLYGDLHWRQLGPFRGGWATMVGGVAERAGHLLLRRRGRRPVAHHRRRADLGRAVRARPRSLGGRSRGGAVRPAGDLHRHRPAGAPLRRRRRLRRLSVERRGRHLERHRAARHPLHRQDLGRSARRRTRCWSAPRATSSDPDPDRGVYRSTDGGRTWATRAEARRSDRRGGHRRRSGRPAGAVRLRLGGAPVSVAELFHPRVGSGQRGLQVHWTAV